MRAIAWTGLAGALGMAILSLLYIAAIEFGPLAHLSLGDDDIFFAVCAARGTAVGEIPISGCHDSKGRALSEISMNVLAQVWNDAAGGADEPALIIADKHGGRNRYHEFLPIVFGDEFIRCMDESLERSRYRVGRAEVRFETRSERYLPVALASMVSKYLRELAMVLFNRFWKSHLADLRPTAGYPLDSRRFRADIAEVQQRLGIADDALWRER